MNTASSKLTKRPFVYTSKIRGAFLSSAVIPWFSETSPQVRITAHKTAKTPKVRTLRSVTVLSMPRGTQVAGWLLESLLLVQLIPAPSGPVATTWLEGIAEYGTGKNESDAITDLVISLGEYREALERRGEKLGDSARKELDYLRKLVERLS